MVRTTKHERIERERALYDEATVERLREEYGHPTAVKRNVKTSATVSELRAAQEFWVDGLSCPRPSDSAASTKVWKTAKAVDEGRTEVNFEEPPMGAYSDD